MMVSALVSAATMEMPMPHHGMFFAAKKVVARVFLIVPEPHAERDDAAEVSEDDDPITDAEIIIHTARPCSAKRAQVARTLSKGGSRE